MDLWLEPIAINTTQHDATQYYEVPLNDTKHHDASLDKSGPLRPRA